MIRSIFLTSVLLSASGFICCSNDGEYRGRSGNPMSPTTATTILRFMKGNKAIYCFRYRQFPFGGMVHWERTNCPRNDQIRFFGKPTVTNPSDTCCASMFYDDSAGEWIQLIDKEYQFLPVGSVEGVPVNEIEL